MKKLFFCGLCLLGFLFGIKAQETAVSYIGLSLRAAEVAKFVELSEEQFAQLKALDELYNQKMDTALNYTEDLTEVSRKIYDANKQFETELFNLLTETQKYNYIRVSSMYEVFAKALFKVELLKNTGKYSDSELEVFLGEIYNYLVLEQIPLVRDRYFILRQEDNIQQLKKQEPQSLREANALQEAKRRGIKYQNGYVW